MSVGKRGSVSRRGVRLGGVGSGTGTSICAGSIRRRDRDTRRVRERGGRLGVW